MDNGMLFEKIVLKVFGKPITPIYFAGYYDTQSYKEILYTVCIYLINYKELKDKDLDKLKEFTTNFSTFEKKSFEVMQYLKEIFDI